MVVSQQARRGASHLLRSSVYLHAHIVPRLCRSAPWAVVRILRQHVSMLNMLFRIARFE